MIETQKVEFPVNGELFSNYETAKVEVLKCEYQIESFLSNVNYRLAKDQSAS